MLIAAMMLLESISKSLSNISQIIVEKITDIFRYIYLYGNPYFLT